MATQKDCAFTTQATGPGAHVTAQGVVYRVWAPDHAEVRVRIRRIGGGDDTRVMAAHAAGYFTLGDERGKPGDRYEYVLSDGKAYPDPASRFQPEGVHGWSCVQEAAYEWRSENWRRPGWRGQSIYELHVGAFTVEGTFLAAIGRLDHLVALGVEAIELMPVADFDGSRNWGYDGVALFAPARVYGRPEDLRALVDAAHGRGLAVILDVVYNHLGPSGNYLRQYARSYFHPDRHTPWGEAFNLDGTSSLPVREFFLANTAYWLDDYRFDGLRLDATHMIHDRSPRHLLGELAGLAHERGAFLIAEDERNSCAILERPDGTGAHLDAAWADDFHHQVRVALTGTQEGYFAGYQGTSADIAATLEHGWFYRGQPYAAWKNKARGEDGGHLPARAFVTCIENHDQVGNRALGERLEHLVTMPAYRAAVVLLCLSPYPPLLFMGQEWAASTPFLFFTDHAGELGKQISRGRQNEFAAAGINQKLALHDIPDPQAYETFSRSKLRWEEAAQPAHAAVLALYQRCLAWRASWLREEATQRDAWRVAAHGGAIVLRYDCPGQPSRLLVSSLRGDADLVLRGHSLSEPPDQTVWRLQLTSDVSRVDADGTLFVDRDAKERDGLSARVEKIVMRVPSTMVLEAHPLAGGETARG
jgi:maltooligosyltrehalose trehalohydrolase